MSNLGLVYSLSSDLQSISLQVRVHSRFLMGVVEGLTQMYPYFPDQGCPFVNMQLEEGAFGFLECGLSSHRDQDEMSFTFPLRKRYLRQTVPTLNLLLLALNSIALSEDCQQFNQHQVIELTTAYVQGDVISFYIVEGIAHPPFPVGC